MHKSIFSSHKKNRDSVLYVQMIFFVSSIVCTRFLLYHLKHKILNFSWILLPSSDADADIIVTQIILNMFLFENYKGFVNFYGTDLDLN